MLFFFKNLHRSFFWLLAAITSPVIALAPLSSQLPVSSAVTLLSSHTMVAPGERLFFVIELNLAPDWHSYWKNPGDFGMALTVAWQLPTGFQAEDPLYLPPKPLISNSFVNFGYSGIAHYLLPIQIDKGVVPGGDYSFALKAEWLVCLEECVPESAEWTGQLRVAELSRPSAFAPTLAQLQSQLPTAYDKNAAIRLRSDEAFLWLEIPESIDKKLFFFPETEGVTLASAPQVATATALGQSLRLTRDAVPLPAMLSGVLQVNDKFYELQLDTAALKTSAVPASTAAAVASDAVLGENAGLPSHWLWALFFAFVGGLLLNLMPCVLPVLSLKALDLLELSQQSPAKAALHGWSYTAGILLSFLALALVLWLLQQSGAAIGWGFQLQSPLFVAILVYVLVAVALLLANVWQLPGHFAGVGDGLTRQGGLWGSFFVGVLAVVVASPCSAPLMAPAIAFALAQPPSLLFLIFIALGLGLAAPFLLFSLLPKAVAWLPKPGLWMENFKQFLAFPMLATALWLAWVLSAQVSVEAVFLVLSGLLAFTFALWWLGKGLSKFWGQALWLVLLLLSVLPLSTLIAIDNGQEPASATTRNHTREIAVLPFTPARLAALQAEDKAIFLNATADWCITCKVNERLALTPKVKAAFAEAGVVYMLADWTRQDTEIAQLLADYGRRGVPLYLWFSPSGAVEVLPQVLTEPMLLSRIEGLAEISGRP
jgi:thiol:disulfide interchange protein DsbD